MEKKLVKVEKIFEDTNEGITILYDKNSCELGVLLWTVDTEYGSADCRLLTLGGTSWDETLKFGVSIENWDGKGYFWVDDFKKVESFPDLVEGERIVSKYIRDFLNEDYFVEQAKLGRREGNYSLFLGSLIPIVFYCNCSNYFLVSKESSLLFNCFNIYYLYSRNQPTKKDGGERDGNGKRAKEIKRKGTETITR